MSSRISDAVDQGRTVAALVGMNAGLAAGIAGGALLRNRGLGRDLSVGPALDLTLALAGIRVRVHGAEHLDERRPVVFAFNHLSNLDPLILVKLVRRDFTSTGKAEVRQDPVAVLAAYAIDAVLIDRGDPEKARAQVAEAARRLQRGDSVLIAPEGTRNPGPEPGVYKTGVVHLALAGGRVPITQVVLRGTRACMPGRVLRPGTVDVAVLPPVPTTDWDAADARAHAAALREQVVATLRDWPA